MKGKTFDDLTNEEFDEVLDNILKEDFGDLSEEQFFTALSAIDEEQQEDILFTGEIRDVLYFRRETVKGKNEGVALTLPSGAKNALLNFLSWKAEVGESLAKRVPLFVSRQGGRLTRQQAHNSFKKAYKKVGLRGHVTTHSPRKTYAKMVYENSNNDLVVTQRALRHTDIQSTLYYLDTLADDVKKAMPNFVFGEIDNNNQKTSNSKVITMPKPKELQARKKQR